MAGRAPKTARVPRTRAGGTWTEAGFWSFLRSGLREVSRRWPPIKHVLQAARQPYVGPNKRRKWSFCCAICGELFQRTEVQVHHIESCGSLKSWEDLPGFASRMLCEAHGLMVLCKKCHELEGK